MKKKQLILEVDCGDKTCASEPGRFCQYLSTRNFGTESYCRIFGQVDYRASPVALETGEDGWLQRWPDCIEAEQTER